MTIASDPLQLMRALRSGGRSIRQEAAPGDGQPLYIGYDDVDVLSPDGQHRTQWLYETEPPHGDSLHQVWLDGVRLPGRYWGRGHAWSADAAYCTLERDEDRASTLYLVRVADRCWLRLGSRCAVVSLDLPVITLRSYGAGDGAAPQPMTLTGSERFSPIPAA
ncbi:MAG: hypothetical protein EOO25_11565 [Comamonadaceae bacterium]|nr:MAG: hypothetical protein EOO25_11565 [Comamonadaceae bacterium]